MSRTRLVVTDLDGTFWHGHEVIHPRTRAAHDELRAGGIEVLIATGRRLRAVTRGTEPAGIGGSAVLMSGAVGADLEDGREWHRVGFTASAAAEVLAAFRDHGIEPVAYLGTPEADAIAAEDCSTNAKHLASFGSHVTRTPPDAWADAGVLVGFGVIGVTDPRLADVAAALGPTAPAWHGPDTTYGGWTLMVGPPGVTKVDGIAAWCQQHGFAAEEVLAVGDGSNDLAMLAWAGTSVAVRGGATAEAGADHLIEGPESGGWSAIVDLV